MWRNDTDLVVRQAKQQIEETRQFLLSLERSRKYTQKYIEEVRKDLAVMLADLKTLRQFSTPGARWHDPEPHKNERNDPDQQPSPQTAEG
jgi:hypothetical protein